MADALTPEQNIATSPATNDEILRACQSVFHRLEAVDAAVVRSVLRGPAAPTDRQVMSLWKILGRQRDALEAAGVDYAALVPPRPGKMGHDVPAGPPPNTIRISWVQSSYGRRIGIFFPHDARLSEVLKGLRRSPKAPPWSDAKTGDWLLPEDFEFMDRVVAALKGAQPDFTVRVDPEVSAAIEQLRAKTQQVYQESKAEDAAIDVPTKLPLRPFQRAGVKWIEDRGGRALIADEMGLGKTVQAIGYLAKHPEVLPALVVCKASLRPNWVKELHRFTDYKGMILSSKTSLKAFKNQGFATDLVPQPGFDACVMNYDLFEAELPQTWIRRLCAGDESGRAFILEAGQYAIRPLNKAYAKAEDIVLKQKLLELIREIGLQGSNANRKKFVKVFANGTPLEQFMSIGFKTLICDESHNMKEAKSQRAMAVHAISPKMSSVVFLTGTPLLNRPREIWSQVYAINPSIWPNFLPFGVRYCDGKKQEVRVKGRKGKGKEVMEQVWNFMGASNLEELDQKLRTTVMIRRLKKDVLAELPPKVRSTIPIVAEKGMDGYRKEAKPILKKLASIKRQRDAWKAKLAGMSSGERKAYLAAHAEEASEKSALAGVAIEQIETLKLLAVNLKFGDAVKFILDTHEQSGKIVVFMSHHATIDRMMKSLAAAEVKAEFIDGRVEGAAREPIKERFQTGDTQILVCGIRAASEGLTLTASHVVIFVEFDWNPGLHQQAEDRIHRIGQTETAMIYYLVAMGTIEDKVAALIDGKGEVVNSALGEGDRTVDEGGILDALLTDICKDEEPATPDA